MARGAMARKDLQAECYSQVVFLDLFHEHVDLKALDRRRKPLLFHKYYAFSTKIRCTGIEHADFGPKSDAQASNMLILVCPKS